tara:strand:- start:1257 stop:2504 length:1248 start_codon:yes stop_codon:yes gene_type:complete
MHINWKSSEYYINPNEIKIIQFEPTSYCNLRCIGCSRTDSHTGLPKKIVLDHQQHISLELIEPIFKNLKNLERIKFDGDIGDCFSHPNLYEIVEKILDLLPNVKILLHTNLSNGTDETFLKLIQLSKRITIIAGVDGLYDECSTYRRGASWKIIQRRFEMLKEYSPDRHKWRWLDFDFNRHQQDEAKLMSIDYKFNEFELATPYSNSNEVTNSKIDDFKENKITHKGILSDKDKVKDIQKNKNASIEKSFELLFNTQEHFRNEINNVKNTKTGRQHICPWQLNKSLQVMSDGTVWPCCWSSDMNKFLSQYGTEKSSHDKAYLNSDFAQQYFLYDWLSKIGKHWKEEITITSKNTMHEVMKSKVYRRLNLLMNPKYDKFTIDKCTQSCSHFIAKDIIEAANTGTIMTNVKKSNSNE